MNTTNKETIRFVAEVVAGIVIGSVIRKKMVDAGMIKSFFTPNILVRKPGTFSKNSSERV